MKIRIITSYQPTKDIEQRLVKLAQLLLGKSNEALLRNGGQFTSIKDLARNNE